MSSPAPGIAPVSAQPEHPPDDPTLERAPAPLVLWQRALGLTLRLATNDERVLRAARDSFGPEIRPSEQPDVALSLLVHHVDEEPGWQPRQPLIRRHSGAFSIVASRSSSVAGYYPAGVAAGFISDTVAGHDDFLRSGIVQATVLGFAERVSLAVIHSACLVRDGRPLLLRGLSGAGKSTLCYAGLRHGWSLLAEDVVFVRATGAAGNGRVPREQLRVHGLPWSLHLLPDALELFPELRGLPLLERATGEVKVCVTVERQFPGQAVAEAPLGPLVFVARGAGRPRIERLSRQRAFDLLRATAILDEAGVHERHGLWDAFLATPAWLLATGDDPDDNARALDDVLASVAG